MLLGRLLQKASRRREAVTYRKVTAFENQRTQAHQLSFLPALMIDIITLPLAVINVSQA